MTDRFINRSKLPPGAFRCSECDAVAGECEHTDAEKNPRYAVRVAGIITGHREPMNEVLVMGPVTPEPGKVPESLLLWDRSLLDIEEEL